jgi:tight adherence protein B
VDALALLVAASVAVAVVLIVIGIFSRSTIRAIDRVALYPTSNAVQVSATGQQGSEPSLLISSSVILSSLQRLLQRSAWSERVARDLGRADITLTPSEYLGFRAAAIVLAVAIAWILGHTVLPSLANPWALLAAAVLGYVIPRLYIRRRQQARLRAFNDNLAETITLIANGLRAGSSLLQSLELVSREARPPVSTEFGRVVREVTIGLPLEAGLNNLVERVRSDDLELLATAISIQYHVGGNLSEILDTISETIRERVRIKGEIRTLTAQQRLSGYVVGFLPVGLLIFLMIVTPRFINPMFQQPPSLFGLPLGLFFLGIGALMMLIGFATIRRIVNIDV